MPSTIPLFTVKDVTDSSNITLKAGVNSSSFGVQKGQSVYELAVEEGFIGTKQEYLNSLTDAGVPRGTWLISTDDYVKGDSVRFNDAVYVALVNDPTVGVDPETNTVEWAVLVDLDSSQVTYKQAEW